MQLNKVPSPAVNLHDKAAFSPLLLKIQFYINSPIKIAKPRLPRMVINLLLIALVRVNKLFLQALRFSLAQFLPCLVME